MVVKKASSKKRKPAAKKRKTKKPGTPVIYLTSLVILALFVLGILQFGLVGLAIDCLMILLTGSARYFTYLFFVMLTIYYTVNKQFVPLNRRLAGWVTLQLGLCLVFESVRHLTAVQVRPTFNGIFETESDSHFHFQGGGFLGYALERSLSQLISPIGALIFALLVLGVAGILIAGRSIRAESKVIFEQLLHLTQQAQTKTQTKVQQLKSTRDHHVIDVSELHEVPVDDVTADYDIQADEPVAEEHTDIPLSHHESRKKEQPVKKATPPVMDDDNPDYALPPLDLLNLPDGGVKSDMKTIKQRGQLLESTLKNFGVNAKVSQIRIGPAVTQYEVQPAMGVKVSRIVNLSNDIALALAAKDIRIEAPIPGKSAVGIEVPNNSVSMVTLREVLEEEPVEDNKLKVVLGRNISGDAITAELNKMPHLLVAGSTGSGKSVCINGIITSILMNAKPHEVKLMMIDPKMVELNVYNGIPHLLTPVVTNPQKAAQALQKIVGEMERRYDLFSHSGTRNIEGYNQYLTRQNEELGEKNAKLPYIVVIVDELADLMMVASKDVESAIMRIAQMARAAGIHLIIATQRPSVDVITGLIKANIPSRIAFAVSSQIDSRTILDSQGAEKLLGRGDMLFLPSGQSKPTRIQGAFLSDKEVEAVVNYVTKQQSANYVKELEPDEIKTDSPSEDALYFEAYEFVVAQQKASASLLQRQFRIGYNRAARLIDELEMNQVIGPASGSKPRQVLIDETKE
ncbi:cell division protein FtsK [Macrococcus equipercicus]|uniref:Cell division protein FtsK n=1 Tax=Macrococcus equipercicus TaxID=69967 RepID=A0A9Q9F262_9STAP|nr:DNA translocase FtsK [Macrococcus equipercicus]UTH14697.1 cell division protein FtsK [Macrococcus equipercicus]